MKERKKHSDIYNLTPGMTPRVKCHKWDTLKVFNSAFLRGRWNRAEHAFSASDETVINPEAARCRVKNGIKIKFA